MRGVNELSVVFSHSRGGEGAGWWIGGCVCLEEEEECDCVITWVKKKKEKKLGLICWNRAAPEGAPVDFHIKFGESKG